MTLAPNVEIIIESLRDSASSKRRKAAKQLRSLSDARAADALLTALEKEVRDRRTWETQYQMIMAVASCCPSDRALPLLELLLEMDLEPMVHLALGDAVVRLSSDTDSAVVSALDSGSLPRAEGAIRALAMTQRVPADSTIQGIIRYASSPKHAQVRFWVAAASPGFPKAIAGDFLSRCTRDENNEIRRAAQAAIDGRYLRWNPL